MTTETSVPGATLRHLCHEITGARIVRGSEDTLVRDVRHDSRDVEPGDLFVARRGLKDDGLRFVRSAVERGAVAVIADRAIDDLEVASVVVPDPELALAVASSAVWNHPSFALEVVGITGTNGKTTTAWLLEHALTALGMPTGLLGTVEHRFGALRWPALHTTPEADDVARRSAAMRDAGAEYLVMEVSSHAIAMKRVAAVRFRVAVLTNVTQDHLDYHGSFERYADAKRSLFTDHGPAASVVNADDAVGRSVIARLPGAIGYSARGADGATLRARDVRFGAAGFEATVATPAGDVRLRSPLAGMHNVENVLAALGTLIALEVPAQRAADALASARGAPGRLERVGSGRWGEEPSARREPGVYVDYAHTPDALTRVLTALRSGCAGRLICVFGCGGDRDPTKRAPMGRAVAEGCDLAVVTTDNPRTEAPDAIAAQAAEGLTAAGMPQLEGAGFRDARRGWVLELDRRRAIERAVGDAREGDVVLIAGKGHEPYQEVHGVRTPFDDRDEARRALAHREQGA